MKLVALLAFVALGLWIVAATPTGAYAYRTPTHHAQSSGDICHNAGFRPTLPCPDSGLDSYRNTERAIEETDLIKRVTSRWNRLVVAFPWAWGCLR